MRNRQRQILYCMMVAGGCLCLSCGVGTITIGPPSAPDVDAVDVGAFEPGFMWGVGSSAHQVEGNNVHSDWWVWETTGKTRSGELSGAASDNWNRFEEDMDRVVALNLDTYRFSLNWARLFPSGMDQVDQDAAARYDQFFEAMAARGIRPMVTLHHFMMPQWLTASDRWASGEAIQDFRRFAEFAAKRWGKNVDWWITVNEPEVFAFHGWMRGVFPPGKTDPWLAYKVFTNLMKAHAEAYHAIKNADQADADGDGTAARVGIANLIFPIEPFNAWNPVEQTIAGYIGNFANLFWFIANETGVFDPKLPFFPGPFEEFPPFRHTLDFVGVNYYSRQVVRVDLGGIQIGSPPGSHVSDLGIEFFPEGLYTTLEMIRPFQLPIVITENGIADAADKDRQAYILAHVAQIAKFKRQHPDTPVLGYVYWSLTDNFEWEHGFSPRFGLYEVDYATQKRTVRNSALTLAELITRVKAQGDRAKVQGERVKAQGDRAKGQEE